MKGLFFVPVTAGLLLAGMGNSLADSVELAIMVGGKTRSVVIELDETAAPQTSRNFKKLCNEGFYNGIAFHRVIPNYIAQAGDPLSKDVAQKANWGKGGPGYKVPAELGQKHVRGAVAAARLSDSVNPSKASSGSQFYVCLRDIPTLDGEYTVFGKVTMGLEYFDEIAGAPADANNIPNERIEIISTRVTAGTPPIPKVTSAETPGTPAATDTAVAAVSEPAEAAAPDPAGAVASGAAANRGLPPMPELSATPSTPSPSPAPVAGSTGVPPIPPMPDLAATPSAPAPVPAPVSPSDGSGIPAMPALSGSPSDPDPVSNFGSDPASGFSPPSELPAAGTAMPNQPAAPGQAQPAPPAKPAKPKGFFGKLIYRFW